MLEFTKNYSFEDLFVEGNLIIADLTDDLIDPNDANNIFRLLINIYKSKNLGISKLLIFDEAHKYISIQDDDLTTDIVDIIRMQRNYGIKTVISTQNPCILNKEIIELSSFIILHRFSSPRWIDYINKLYYKTITLNIFEDLLNLKIGHCFIICPKDKIFNVIKIQSRKTIGSISNS